MKKRSPKQQNPLRFRIILATSFAAVVAVQLGLIAWLGEHGMVVLVDLAVVALAVISIFKIKTFYGWKLYQATFRELAILGTICLVFHFLVFPMIGSSMPHAPATVAGTSPSPAPAAPAAPTESPESGTK